MIQTEETTMLSKRYQLIIGEDYDLLVRVHVSSTGLRLGRTAMAFIQRGTLTVYEAQDFTTPGRMASRRDTPFYLSLAELAVEVTS